MLKSKAIEQLGGTITAAADAVGVSYQAVDKWPEVLPDRIADRVLAALARRHMPKLVRAIEGKPKPEDVGAQKGDRTLLGSGA